jgi:hypothetical protein
VRSIPHGKGPLTEKKNDDYSSSKVDLWQITAVCILSFVLLMTDRHHSFISVLILFRVHSVRDRETAAPTPPAPFCTLVRPH